MSKISLLVPSRERLNLKLTLLSSIITTVSDINNVELIFGVDEDDPTRDIVYKIAAAMPFVKIVDIQNNKKFIGINKIWNILAAQAQGDILGYIGDDMIFKTLDWDKEIITELTDKLPVDQIKLVHCYDGYRTTDEICVNAFVHKKYVDIIGYLCREEFLINWSDQWMYQTFKAFDRVTYRPDIHIQHNHWIFGHRKKDAVADRMLSDNKDRISDQLWFDLVEQRIIDVQKIATHTGLIPNWNVVDTQKNVKL